MTSEQITQKRIESDYLIHQSKDYAFSLAVLQMQATLEVAHQLAVMNERNSPLASNIRPPEDLHPF